MMSEPGKLQLPNHSSVQTALRNCSEPELLILEWRQTVLNRNHSTSNRTMATTKLEMEEQKHCAFGKGHVQALVT